MVTKEKVVTTRRAATARKDDDDNKGGKDGKRGLGKSEAIKPFYTLKCTANHADQSSWRVAAAPTVAALNDGNGPIGQDKRSGKRKRNG